MPIHPNLRVVAWLDNTEEENVKRSDFSTFLKKESPAFFQGRKVSSEYKDDVTDDVVVKKTYTDTLDANSNLNGIDILIEWYSTDSSVGLSKAIHKPLNFAEAGSLQRKRRVRAIDYLVASGKDTPVEPFMTLIFDTYKEQIQTWYDMGDSDIVGDAIEAELDPSVISALSIVTDPILFPGKDVQDYIYEQINYTPPA